MNKIFYSIIISLIVLINSNAQTVPVFGWQSHFSYNSIQHVEPNSLTIYAGTDKVLYSISAEDNSIQFFNKVTSLSDVGIGAMTYESELLVIGYQNGNLDLIIDGFTTNITTILDADNLEEKSFRSLKVKDNDLWGGLDFGMIRYDLQREEFTETYQNIGQNGARVGINDFLITSDSIIAASDDGILSVSLDENTNRPDFNFWQRQLTGIAFEQISQTTISNYASIGRDLFIQNQGKWEFLRNFNSPISDLKTVNSTELYVLTESSLYRLAENVLDQIISVESSWGQFQSISINNGQIIIGTSLSGLLIFTDPNSAPQIILPQGPATDDSIISADSSKAQYWVDNGQLSIFDNELSEWKVENILNSNNQLIQNINNLELASPDRIVNTLRDGPFIRSGSTYLSIHEEASNNSPLIEQSGSLRVPDTEYANGKLWIVQNEVDQPLTAWDPFNDQWEVFTLNNPLRNFIQDIYIVSNGDKWMPVYLSRGGGILVFNEESNRLRYLNTNGGQGGLPGREITDITQDQDGFIWVTTNEGVCFFPSPNQILSNSSITANIPIFDGRLLLRDEYLTSITIDPANRKWIGTRDNGVWLFTETGEELVQHFTIDDSPLPSDQVNKIGIDDISGKVFFTTTNGIVSFRSDATEGSDKHQNVKIYPNPVTPNFSGNIVIEGLVNNAFLKLTDASGKLVREIRANGSTAIWNARALDGKRVSAGVYLVFSSNRDGSETFIGKIVVI